MLKLHVLTLISVLLLAVAVGCSSIDSWSFGNGDVDPPECDRIRLTLSDAAHHDCADTARTLIEPAGSIPGVDVNAPDDNGNVPLVIAASWDSFRVAALLIDRGADIEVRDVEGRTLLHIAAKSNSPNVARILIDSGVDIDAKDNYGNTALSDIDPKEPPWGITFLRAEGVHKHRFDFATLLIELGASTYGIDLSWMSCNPYGRPPCKYLRD